MNYVRAVEISQNENVTEPKVNEAVEKFTEENNFQLFETALRKCETEDSVVEVEIVELMTSVKETLQFPEIEEISEFSKTVEVSQSQVYYYKEPSSFFIKRFYLFNEKELNFNF